MASIDTQFPRNGWAVDLRLFAVPQWIAWSSVVGEGLPTVLPNRRMTYILKRQTKPHKLPINPRSGGLAATTRAKTWSSFADAYAAAQKWSITGIGFVFSESDPYAGVDIDNCRNPETGQVADWAWRIIRALDSYTEVSPSGTGVHIILRGNLPTRQGNQAAFHGGKVEMFSRDRYFTFTGIPLDGTPSDIRDRQTQLQALHAELFAERPAKGSAKTAAPLTAAVESDVELIRKAQRARNGSKFQRLWNGNWAGDYESQSEADLALCCQLAFWTGKDAVRINHLFRQSRLMRDKWDSHSYADRTIEAALAKGGDSYKPGQRTSRTAGSVRNPEKGSDLIVVCDGVANPDLLRFPHTDTGNAERLVRMYGDDIRFCVETKKWLVWDGRRWNLGDPRKIKNLLKKTIRETYRQAADIDDRELRVTTEKHARKSESANLNQCCPPLRGI
jgi:putative DNA primase/helicase